MGYIADDGNYYEDNQDQGGWGGGGDPYLDPSEFTATSDPWGGGGGGGDTGEGVWDENGNFIGQSTNTNDAGGGIGEWLKNFLGGRGGDSQGTGASALAKGAGALMKNQQDKRELAARAAIAESNLDPFRGYMHQAKDVGRLDMMANANFTAPATTIAGRYGDRAGTAQPGPGWNPSDTTRSVASLAMRAVAGGNKAPTMTDPANYGRLPVVSYTAPAPQTAAPGVLPTTTVPPTGQSPWLGPEVLGPGQSPLSPLRRRLMGGSSYGGPGRQVR